MKNFITIFLLGISLLTSSYTKRARLSEIAKQLVYPVTGTKSNIGSVWGDERDGGRRKHEGIDIFAAKGTPVVALSDGIIESAGNNEIGGNNITLQPYDFEWNAYYAHLDKIYVTSGQRVKKGQLIGSVGNTGNARTTPPHLHFGMYTAHGPIDPLPYVKTSLKISSPVQPGVTETTSTSAPKQQKGKVAKTTNQSGDMGTAIKKAAVQVIAGELLRRIKIKL